ncbi:MAG: phosphatase PAP2 family protein [Acidimicrobiales bacterium]
MDAALFRWVNRLADRSSWAHGAMTDVAKYGILVFAVLLVLAWWQARRAEDAVTAVSAVVWAAVASLIGFVAVQLIGTAVSRDRPYVAMPSAHLLVARTGDFSFPSDHATAAAAIAVGLIIAGRYTRQVWVGWSAATVALVLGFSRVYVGAHYPGDVVGGFVLASAVAWGLAPFARRLLRPLVEWLRAGPLGVLVVADAPPAAIRSR